jgi:hypothetical protein
MSPAAIRANQMAVAWASYHRTLLKTAQTLIADTHFGPALTLAHTAAEISTERVFAAWFRTRGIQDLEEAITDTLPNYNLRNERVRGLYLALTGDRVTDQPFWQAFTQSRQIRESFVHGAGAVSREQAEDGCRSISLLLDHLETILEKAQRKDAPEPVGDPHLEPVACDAAVAINLAVSDLLLPRHVFRLFTKHEEAGQISAGYATAARRTSSVPGLRS